ncbi:MAG: hypothetical protein H7Y05_07365 [Steroidobacteraceae bacterium]|nr:hypothetical protein [Deltaproteobacteria bacterium]
MTWSCTGFGPPGFTPLNAACSASIPTYTLNFQSSVNGTLAGSLPQTVTYGLNATTVTATPNTGYQFVSWTDGTGVVSTNPALTVTNVVTNRNYTANFTIITFTLDYAAGVNGTLSGPAAQTVNYFANAATVTAVPSPGNIFINWIEGATAVSTTPALTVNNVTANHVYTAIFATAYNVTLDQCVTGPTVVASGSSPTYTFPTGFNVVAQVNGVPVNLVGFSYTLPPIGADQIFTASYTPNPAGSVAARIVRGAATLDFTLLQDAYNAAANNETIMLLAGTMTGNLSTNSAKTVTLRGGYDAGFASSCGITRVGAITLGIGTLLFDRVAM